MNNEALEALKSAIAKAKTMGLKGQDCVPAYIAEVCEAADKYLEALTPEVDLEELKEKICDEIVTWHGPVKGGHHDEIQASIVSSVIDIIASRCLLSGLVLVPEEPTFAMEKAAMALVEIDIEIKKFNTAEKFSTGTDLRNGIYKAMIKAARGE